MRRVRLGAVIALALAAGFVAWLVIHNRSSTPSSQTSTTRTSTKQTSTTQTTSGPVAKAIAPIALSANGLRTLAQAVDQPIYWDGPKLGYKYELTRTTNGRVFVRYLPRAVKAGAPESRYLIVATYPFPNALAALKAVSDPSRIALAGGAIAVVDKAYPKSVHLAYPGVPYQIEVYDPSPARARRVAASGGIQPVH
jgi:hypothetical protein